MIPQLGGPAKSFNFGGGRLGGLGAFAFLLYVLSQSHFTVDPAERAFVRRFGQVTTDKPYGPGFHLRVPFITSVDRGQVSPTNLHIPVFSVNTIDNQKIDLGINARWR